MLLRFGYNDSFLCCGQIGHTGSRMTSPLRRPLIAGNWKMHLNLSESVELARAVKEGEGGPEVALCVPLSLIHI